MLWLLANLLAVWETVTGVIGALLLLVVLAFIVHSLAMPRFNNEP